MSTTTRTSGTLTLTLVTLAVVLVGSPGCRAIEGIFKAGIWAGVLGLVFLLAIVFGITRLVGSR